MPSVNVAILLLDELSICNIRVKRNILVINEMKRDETVSQPKVWTEKNFVQYCELSLNSMTKFAQLSSIFNGMNKRYLYSGNI
jgi:hypothetical protein